MILSSNQICAQSNFGEIKDKVLQLRNKFLNKNELKKEIDIIRTTELQPIGEKDIGTIALKIGYLYSELNQLDSAFYFLEINQISKSNGGITSNFSPILNLIDDPRFDTLLSRKFIKLKGKNNLGIEVYKNTSLVRETAKMGILQNNISNLWKYTEGDYRGIWRELKLFSDEFTAYKTRRYLQIVAENGIPTYSDHGYDAPSKLLNHLFRYSIETLFDRSEELEKLALDGEIAGELPGEIVDEKLISNGKKQKYGTQFIFLDRIKKVTPFPIEDRTNVNKRRKAIGIEESLEDAIFRLEKTYKYK